MSFRTTGLLAEDFAGRDCPGRLSEQNGGLRPAVPRGVRGRPPAQPSAGSFRGCFRTCPSAREDWLLRAGIRNP